MVDSNMDWMNQCPLVLLCVLHKMLRYAENILTKYDPDKKLKAKDHLDKFYLHLRTLEVCYDDVTCILFPCTLDGREVVWYHSLPPNSIQNWRGFKKIFIEKFVEDKSQDPCHVIRVE